MSSKKLNEMRVMTSKPISFQLYLFIYLIVIKLKNKIL